MTTAEIEANKLVASLGDILKKLQEATIAIDKELTKNGALPKKDIRDAMGKIILLCRDWEEKHP